MAAGPAARDESPLAPLNPEAEVLRWRQEQFQQLGLSAREAAELAASEADLGQARYLRGCGCPPQLALEILR
jgi:hypothetical protein